MRLLSLMGGVLAFVVSISAIAQETISLDESVNLQNIGLKVDFIEDPRGEFELSQLLSSSATWQSNRSETINFGFTSSTYWYRLLVQNASGRVQDYLLSIEYSLLDKADIYWGSYDNGFSHGVFGRSLPLSSRSFKHRYFVQQLNMQAEQKLAIYLRVETQSAMQVPISIRTKKSFIEKDQNALFVQGLYFGSIMAMLLYNLFLYISVRDKTYLAYAASVFFVGFMQATLHGFTSLYIFPDSPLFQTRHLPIVVSLSGVFLGLFTIMFLELKTRSRALYYIAWFFVIVHFINAITSPLLGYQAAARLSVLVTMINAVLTNYTGFYIWYRGFKPASYYAIAYSMFMMAVVLANMNKLGVVPRNVLTEYALEIGSLLEIILLSFALAYRISILKQDKEQAQRDLTVNLEKMVSERTEELDKAMRLLSSLNNKLAKQNIEDSLSGLFNRRYFDKTIAGEWSRSIRSAIPITLIMADIDYFKTFNDEHGHAVGDECIKLVSSQIKSGVTRMDDKVFRYGGEEFAIVLPATELSGGQKLAEKIRSAIAQQVLVTRDDLRLTVTISLGVASTVPQKGENFERLVRHADSALYLAKDKGRNRVETYDITLKQSVQARS